MNEEDYSNREIDRMFLEIQDSLKRIEDQTTKTNGRVSSLESWRQYTLGALAVITLLVIPTIVYFLNYSLNKIDVLYENQTAAYDTPTDK